ncbi:hypothetical protein NEOCIP111885_02443 [Pseudoneobacillus rhizosphaerae]|uniref:Uncharacterized protein n=1 Tax=Pseudoneobacillus rhizosphaerae TaxID=2880968 RepID=A0A9C7GAD3_9BACI|nr:hypothetical protein NEOCIP111885_02443 [Pseudoneobacillus rhizosphaerae]
MNFLKVIKIRRKYIQNKEILSRACLRIFLGGLGIFFYAIWNTFFKLKVF